MSKTPVVAIVGRPNVGKSSLFNALIGSSKSIVSDIAGTTRDSVMHRVEGEAVDYWLIDTAGLTNVAGLSLEEEVQLQVKSSLEHADVIMFVIDSRVPPTLDDEEIIQLLRKSKKPILFVANKVDDGQPYQTMEWARTGFGVPIQVSAKNNTMLWDLIDALETKVESMGFIRTGDEPESDRIQVAFVGRPNVGKSSLLNALVDKNRSVVSDVSGTTRDAIDSYYTDEENQDYTFIDTAGMRKRGKQIDIEYWSGVRTVRAIERSDVCVVLIDALDGVTHQDMAIVGRVIEAGKGLIIAVNKYDLLQEKSRAQEETDEREIDELDMWGEDLDKMRAKYINYLSKKLPFCPWAPAAFFSALTGKGIKDLLPSIKGIYLEREKRISTSELNNYLPDLKYGHVLPSVGHKIGKMKYITQADSKPPTFLLFVNNVEAFHFSYRRYLENRIREKYGFQGTPIKIKIRDARDERHDRPKQSQKKGPVRDVDKKGGVNRSKGPKKEPSKDE